MRPKEHDATPQSDLFRLKLENLIDLRHELCRLAETISCQSMVDEFGPLYAEAGRPGARIYDALLLRCAAKANCDRVYTFNVRDFRAIAPPGLAERICAP